MSDIEVRPITDAEIPDWTRCTRTAFHAGSDVTEEHVDFARWIMNDLSRRMGGFIDGSLSGTAGSFVEQLTVPGGVTVPMAAVTQVTVLPTHRRRGLLREMMHTQLRDVRGRGELVAMLIAAEWPIYGRFGYGLAVEAAATIVDAGAAEFRDPTLRGSIEIVDLPEFRTLAPAIFDAHRVQSPGAITRGDIMWDALTGVVPRPSEDPPKGRVRVVRRTATGELDAYAVYETRDEWVHNRPQVKLSLLEAIAATDEAYVDLWRYVCSVDWVTEINARVRAVDEDIRQLFVNGRVARQADRSDHMWVRLLDVPGALAARRYEVPVSLVIDVRDDLFGDGRYRLEGDATGASCEPTDAPADVTLGVDVLGGLYLGGGSVRPYQLAGRVEELTSDATARLDRSMRTARAPWATTNF